MQVARGLTLSSKNPTFSNSKKVFSEISDAIRGPNVWWRGRSFAASVPSESDSPKSPSGQKRVTKNERRVMVEAFVDEYRASNAGKYPNPTITVKQVGGSFYTIKKIIQELEYNSKQPPTNLMNKGPLVKDVPKGEYKSVSKVEEVSSSETTVGLSLGEPSLGVMDESGAVIINKLDEATNNGFVEKGPSVSTHVEKPLFDEAVDSTKIGDDSSSVTTSSQQIVLESKEVSHTHTEKPKDSVEETAKSEGLFDLNGPERKVMHEAGQKALKSDKLERDMSRKETKEEDQLSTRSTVWGNLRSFADGVIKLWRNM